MAILDFMTKKPILNVLSSGSRGRTFALILKRLAPQQLLAIRSRLDAMIADGEIFTSSWMPGNDWRGTPFQPIFDDAAQGDRQTSALMFGLLVWEAFERHPDTWYTGKFEKDGIPIDGRTYFKPTY